MAYTGKYVINYAGSMDFNGNIGMAGRRIKAERDLSPNEKIIVSFVCMVDVKDLAIYE